MHPMLYPGIGVRTDPGEVHDTKRVKFRVQKFESHSVLRVEEYVV